MPRAVLKRAKRHVLASAALCVTCVALAALFLVASYSLDVFNVLGHGQVATDLYLQNRSQHVLELDVESNGGNQLGTYSNFFATYWDDVANGPRFETLHPTARTLKLLTLGYKEFAARNQVGNDPEYIDWSRATIPALRGYGLGTGPQMRYWLKALQHSDDLHLVFHSGGNYLFRVKAADRG